MQIFHRSTNTISRVSIAAALLFVVGVIAVMQWFVRSDYFTGVGTAVVQPVQFPHQHHVAGLGIDCRYCHHTVAESSYATIPPTQICMNCHNQIWSGSPYLEIVRASWRTGESIPWNKVHRLPQHVYFNHSIHVKKGVSCYTCHGPVDQMPLVWKAETMHMQWCLKCHENPSQYIGPATEVVSSSWEVPTVTGGGLDDPHEGIRHINGLTQCYTCHR
jgi:hypothetical protein